MQTITTASCPTSRTLALDARDNRTYWVQKLSDGKCWMLTNLAYAGGGSNTYNDVKTITNGNGLANTFTVARYYAPVAQILPQALQLLLRRQLAPDNTDIFITGALRWVHKRLLVRVQMQQPQLQLQASQFVQLDGDFLQVAVVESMWR